MYTKREYKNECEIVKVLENGSAFVTEKGYEKRWFFGKLTMDNKWETTYVDDTIEEYKSVTGFRNEVDN